jgi:predicted transcriptional regulator
MEKLNSKKIKSFLREINDVEYRYLELTMQIVSGIKSLISRYNLSKEEFCKLFGITPKVYDRYICGDFTYKLDDMATLNYAYQKLEKQRIDEEEKIKIAAE